MRGFQVTLLALALSFPTSSIAQNSGTANSTPQYREKREKSESRGAAEFAAKNAARARAAKEAAKDLSKKGYDKAGKAAKWVSKRKGVAGGVLGNPKTACAPSKESDC